MKPIRTLYKFNKDDLLSLGEGIERRQAIWIEAIQRAIPLQAG